MWNNFAYDTIAFVAFGNDIRLVRLLSWGARRNVEFTTYHPKYQIMSLVVIQCDSNTILLYRDDSRSARNIHCY